MKSPAKINLSLRILGRRTDGFHELETVFQEIDLCDMLEFYPDENWTLQVRGGDPGPAEENLVYRAAKALSTAFGVPFKGRVLLHKQIPIGGGLGGGSSNAAITLHGLCKLWGIGYEWEQLQAIAAELGSDCPFFIYGGMARGRGRGERLELFDNAPCGSVVAVFPGFGVNTAKAFSMCEYDLTEPDKNAIFIAYPLDGQGANILFSNGVNDLENIVLRMYPVLSEIRDELQVAGADVSLLSGSGSTVFGIFRESTVAMQAAQQLRTRYTVYNCRMVGRQRRAENR